MPAVFILILLIFLVGRDATNPVENGFVNDRYETEADLLTSENLIQ